MKSEVRSQKSEVGRLIFAGFLLFTVHCSLFTSSAHAQGNLTCDTNTGAILWPTNFLDGNNLKTSASISNDLAAVAAFGYSNAVVISGLTDLVAQASAALTVHAGTIASNVAAIATLTDQGAALTGQVAAAASDIVSNTVKISVITNQVLALQRICITNAALLQGTNFNLSISNNTLNLTVSTNMTVANVSGNYVLRMGTNSTTPGYSYHWVTNTWLPTLNTDLSQCNRLLAIALGTNSASDGMLRFGQMPVTNTSLSPGGVIFVSSPAGAWTQIMPSNHLSVIRAIGHAVSTNAIFVAPDAVWGIL